MHVYKPPRVGGLDRVPVYTAGTGSTRADLFELDGVTPMPDNVLVADTSGNLPSFQCATSPVYVGVSGSRTTWTPSESGEPSAASGVEPVFVFLRTDAVVIDPQLTVPTPASPGNSTNHIERNVTHVPAVFAAGQGLHVTYQGSGPPVFASIHLTVANMSGTQILAARAEYLITPGVETTFVLGTTEVTVGTDLSLDVAGKVVTAAGGVFMATLHVDFS